VKEATSEGAQRSFALRLYKALLRAHRTVLPDAMRSLGDAYVREEFQLHKTAKPEHLHGFFTQWIQCQQTNTATATSASFGCLLHQRSLIVRVLLVPSSLLVCAGVCPDLEQMRSQGPGQWGSPLTAEQLAALNSEQRAQLELLQKAAERLDAQWEGMVEADNPVTKPE
jgi:hypothetical protein